ncbi:MAG: thioredoxin domain-containing protein, partial [Planctomycetes bacterium]|nr:thioredoxin domain-containing protein [Planctomycetota bacterium]
MRQHLTRPPAIGLGVAAALALGIACGLEGVARLDDGSEKPGKLEKPGKPERKPNRLAREKSPYLLQHAHNPVDWFPWGPEAFEKARREGKPVFLSIGYSTCHWCHVMERESFEDERIAVYLNERFVAIKVDREERPDVDAVYMAACQAQTGSGGWPLSAFLTPEGKPFFTGTYFPPEDDPRRGPGFLSILGRVADAWKEDRARLEEGAEALARHLRAQAEALKAGLPLKGAVLRAGFEAFRDSHDDARGGFGGPPRFAPKFPRTVALDFLMAYASTKAAREDGTAAVAERMVQGTLDAMLRGGIRDHLAGGFHRYSTDRRWLVPHFEKMLYDQALIARTLAHAWRRTRKEPYRAAARETLDYVLARLAGPEGELYSAEDADTEGAEGKTYVWRRTEVLDLLGKDRGERFAELYG